MEEMIIKKCSNECKEGNIGGQYPGSIKTFWKDCAYCNGTGYQLFKIDEEESNG